MYRKNEKNQIQFNTNLNKTCVSPNEILNKASKISGKSSTQPNWMKVSPLVGKPLFVVELLVI